MTDYITTSGPARPRVRRADSETALPTQHHERRTPPCSCGYPLLRSDRGKCPRCAMGAEFRAVESAKGPA